MQQNILSSVSVLISLMFVSFVYTVWLFVCTATKNRAFGKPIPFEDFWKTQHVQKTVYSIFGVQHVFVQLYLLNKSR